MSRSRFSLSEFALVIFVAFGWSMISSIAGLLQGPAVGNTRAWAFGETHLWTVVVSELICFPIIAGLLYMRGWRVADFPMGIGKAATILGVAIFAATWLFSWLVDAAFSALFSALRPEMELWDTYRPRQPPSLVAIYVLSVINPVFEELIVCGYVLRSLSGRFGMATAINVSVLIRTTYHLYQGVVSLPFHIAYGLIQAHVYARFGKLWPLIVSHALLDFFALLAFW